MNSRITEPNEYDARCLGYVGKSVERGSSEKIEGCIVHPATKGVLLRLYYPKMNGQYTMVSLPNDPMLAVGLAKALGGAKR